MKISLPHHLQIIGTAFFILCVTTSAETYHLKDGTSIEGRLISETEDSYILEVLVGRGIWNEITLPKDDVAEVQKAIPGENEFEELKKLIPIPDLLTPNEYTQRIEKIRLFISNHSKSDSFTQAEEILHLYLKEFEVIEAGGIKLNGRLIPADERLADLYYIDSRVAEAQILKLLHSSGSLSALRAFAAFEAEFSGSEAWRGLLPVMQQVVASHQNNARELLSGFDERMARQETGLSRMALEERQATMRAIAERDAKLKSRHEQERGTRGYWLSISPDYKPALEETIRMADQESRRLSTAANQPLKQPTPSQVWRNAISAIKTGDETQIRSALQAARAARMHDRYVAQLQRLADDAAAEVKRMAEEARRLAEEAQVLAEKEKEEEEETE